MILGAGRGGGASPACHGGLPGVLLTGGPVGVDGEGQGSRLSSKEGKNGQGTARSQPYREGISLRDGRHQGHPGGRNTHVC